VRGRVIARYLERPVQGYEPFASSDPAALRKSLEPGDVLLVEGNSHISGVIKYLTQSTWSHAALCVGPIEGTNTHEGEPHVLVEAEIGEGVVSSPLSKYCSYHTRICRPIGLSAEDRATVCGYAIDRIGFDYDLRNIIDLMRYLVPLPVPQRWRRRMIALGSGNPTRLICSALIAQAFEAVRYPILPKVTQLESEAARREILEIRHSSLYAPRDFDISPYFTIVKPTLLEGFNYKSVHWADLPAPFPASRHVWAARGPSFHNLSFCEWARLARQQRAADLINRRHPTEEFLNIENRGVHHRGGAGLESGIGDHHGKVFSVVGIPKRRLYANVGIDAHDKQIADTLRSQRHVEIGPCKSTVTSLVDNGLLRKRVDLFYQFKIPRPFSDQLAVVLGMLAHVL
jgi:Permuted papain-like amidase enzyme, YaeF/YiiX, C92 family